MFFLKKLCNRRIFVSGIGLTSCAYIDQQLTDVKEFIPNEKGKSDLKIACYYNRDPSFYYKQVFWKCSRKLINTNSYKIYMICYFIGIHDSALNIHENELLQNS